jgi:Putative metal-binding motif
MSRRSALVLTSVGLLGVLLTGCSAGMDGESGDFATEEAAGEASQPVLSPCTSGQLNSGFMTHTCNHALYGPWYGTRAASTTTPPWFGVATGDTTTNAMTDPLPANTDSGSPHFYYTVTLPSAGGGVYSGKMKFKTGSTHGAGDYAIIWNNVTSILVKQGATTINRDSAITANPGVMSCSGFTGYNVYPLTASTSTQYDITLTANTPTVNISFERVADHRKRLYQDLDGDGWGNTGVSVLSACAPWAAYPATQGADCNESNASIYPTASETCSDGIDSNCNGSDCT